MPGTSPGRTLPATTPACSSTGGTEATSESEPREARGRRLAVDGSELVFILMPIVIPLFLAIGIAASYIGENPFNKRLRKGEASGRRSVPGGNNKRYDGRRGRGRKM